MKTIFETALKEDTSANLSIEIYSENEISIEIQNYNFINKGTETGIAILSKEELSHYIGLLLHIQSKLRKSNNTKIQSYGNR